MRFAQRLSLITLLVLTSAAAQSPQGSPRLDERLPANTQLYLYWHGFASMQGTRPANSLMRLWDDPEFAPAREAILERFMKDNSGSLPPNVTKEAVLSMLDNQAILGVMRLWPSRPPASAATGTAPAPQPDRSFLVYDATGKLPIVQAAMQLLPASDGKPLNITRTSFSKSTIESFPAKRGVTHRSIVGNYYIQSDDRQTLEQLVKQFETPWAPGLAQDANYQSARRAIGDATTLDMFINLRALADQMQESLAKQAPAGGDAALKSLRVDSIRAAVMGLKFEAPATRIRAAVLGDMAHGGLFDVVGASSSDFVTAKVAPAGSASYSAFRVDLGGFYRSLRASLKSSLTAEQFRNVEQLEAAADTALGMPLQDALQLLSGEMATFALESGADFEANAFAFAIRKPEEVLHIVRQMFGSSISSESREGDATHLAVAMPYRDSKTGMQRKRFYYAAITPQMLIVAPRKAMLREVMQRYAAGTAPNLAADSKFLAARTRVPQALSGFGYADLSRIQWENEVRVWSEIAGSESSAASASPSAGTDWRKLVSPAALSRHLHLAVTGWWKQGDGLYFDGFIE